MVPTWPDPYYVLRHKVIAFLEKQEQHAIF